MAPNTLRNTADLLVRARVIARHGDRLWLHPDLGVVVGVDVAEGIATVAVSRFDFEPINDVTLDRARRAIPIDDPVESIRQIAQLIADHLEEWVGEQRVRESLIGVGLTLPGPILRERNPDTSTKLASIWNRRVQAGPILPGWDDVDVAADLATVLMNSHGIRPPRHAERRFVWIENDASAGALGVHTEIRTNLAEQAPDDLLYVRMTTGIGAGIVNKGHLVAGARGFAGELGHVVVDPSGTLCPACGGRGCLETLASNRAVGRQLRALFRSLHGEILDLPGRPEVASFDSLLQIRHPAVDRALRDAGSHVGTLLAQVVGVLNPSSIVLGGAMPEHRSAFVVEPDGRGARPFVDAVASAIELHAPSQAHDGLTTVTWSEVRSDEQTLTPELLGALALVIDHLGDAYLLKPIERWIASPSSRQADLSFSAPCADVT